MPRPRPSSLRGKGQTVRRPGHDGRHAGQRSDPRVETARASGDNGLRFQIQSDVRWTVENVTRAPVVFDSNIGGGMDGRGNSVCDREHNRSFKPIFILLIVDTLSIRLRTYLMVPIKESFLGAADDDVRPCYNEVVHLHPLQGRAMWMMVKTSVSGRRKKSYPSSGLPFFLDQEHGRRAKAAHPVEL